jgi:type II secretory pathway predicted ATPase ExeA
VYENFYGFAEKPFSLTPDPKYLYRSQSHANAFELLQYAIRRREGFVVVTGDIGTGKTTLCRALLEQIDRTTFTALVLNPFLSEEDLLKRILLDFGVISREELKKRNLTGVSKQELIDAISDFLLGLIPLKASAMLIIDEAQNLPLQVLEQIRILSNLETDKEKLLQIILVGQLELQTLLRSPELRQLDQRVSIRYELRPLDAETVAAYVAHRLTIAGGSASVAFTAKALAEVHRLSGGIPRLINLICDRALLGGFSLQTNRITEDMVRQAATSLDLRRPSQSLFQWFHQRPSLAAAAVAALLASTLAVGVTTTLLYQRFGINTLQASTRAMATRVAASVAGAAVDPLPPHATLTILAGSFPATDATRAEVAELTEWLRGSGYDVYYAAIDRGPDGRWQRVLAGAYTDPAIAAADAARLNAVAPDLGARLLTSAAATGTGR